MRTRYMWHRCQVLWNGSWCVRYIARKVTHAAALQVSPHELLQAVIDRSERRFTGDAEADPVAFCTWLLNALHLDLTGGARKKSSVITECFQVRSALSLCCTGVCPHSCCLQERPQVALDLKHCMRCEVQLDVQTSFWSANTLRSHAQAAIATREASTGNFS